MSINPYQPPDVPVERVVTAPLVNLTEDGPIAFAGVPSEDDLKRFIACHADVGYLTSFISTVFMIFVCVMVTFSTNLGAILLCYGVCSVLGLAVVVSTRTYRRLSFKSMNPDWQRYVTGELGEDGLVLRREHGDLFLRWDCFTDVVAGKSVIGLMTMMELGQCLVIGEAMLTRPADEDQINSVVRTLRRQLHGDRSFRKRMLLALLKEKDRQRSLEVPEGAIAYGGPLYSDDFHEARRFLPRRFQSRLRPLVTMCVMGLGFYLVLLGTLMLLLANDGALAMSVSLVLLAIGIFTYRWKNLPAPSGNQLVQHLLAYADEDGVTSDGVVITTRFPWSHVCVIQNEESRVLMCHTESRRVMVARQEMFANDGDWQQFKQWVQDKAVT